MAVDSKRASEFLLVSTAYMFMSGGLWQVGIDIFHDGLNPLLLYFMVTM
jgi:hypothetical protein